MFFLSSVCQNSEVLKVIYFVMKLLDLVFLLVPILLILMVTVDFAKNVIASKEDDMRKNFNLTLKRILMAVGLFLVPTIVKFAIALLGDFGVPYTDCLDNANLKNISAFEEAEKQAQAEKDSQETSSNKVNDLSGGSTVVSSSGGSSEDDIVMKTSSKLKINKTIKYLMYEDSYTLKVESSSGESLEDVKWSTSNSNIVTVNQSGKVTAVGGGLAVVTATVGSEAISCKVVAVRNTFKKLNGNPYRTTATIYYDGDKKITYYFRAQGYNTACSSEKVDGKQICTSGFRTWYQNHGCGTTSVTAVVNAYMGNSKDNLISEAKMRMYYEKKEYSWSCNSSDPYCDKRCFQFTRKRVADVLNNQFGFSATAYVIKGKTGNEDHIERITNALAQGRPVIIFVNAGQAGTTKFTSQNHTLTMVGFADDKGNILILDSSHNGIKDEKVSKMVNQYIGRGTGNYRGYIVLNETKS